MAPDFFYGPVHVSSCTPGNVLRPSSSSTTMPLPQRPRRVSAEALDVMPAAEPRSSLAATSADKFFNTCVDGVLVL